MKIGIITWFHYDNYGTKLQAIALQSFLRKQNLSVELINFYPPKPPKQKKEIFNVNISKSVYKRIYRYILKLRKNKYKSDISNRNNKLKMIIEQNCNVSKFINSKEDYINVCNSYDLIICGSDQIWNPNWYHPYYYANFKEISTPLIGYAPSIGVIEINNNILLEMKKAMLRFDKIYMREKSGAQIVSKLLHENINTVVDPTLLLSQEEWKEQLKFKDNTQSKYTLCYLLGENKKHWEAIHKFVKENNMELVIIPTTDLSYSQKGEICASAGVEDFVELIANAEIVITDSFHGLIFSIIFKRNFYLIERFDNNDTHSQNSRIHDLMDDLNIEDRILDYNCQKIDIALPIDYKSVDSLLKFKIEESKMNLMSEIFVYQKQ